jgi:hypothetical protein
MHEHVFATVLRLNKTKSLTRIEPLHCTACHKHSPLFVSPLWRAIPRIYAEGRVIHKYWRASISAPMPRSRILLPHRDARWSPSMGPTAGATAERRTGDPVEREWANPEPRQCLTGAEPVAVHAVPTRRLRAAPRELQCVSRRALTRPSFGSGGKGSRIIGRFEITEFFEMIPPPRNILGCHLKWPVLGPVGD